MELLSEDPRYLAGSLTLLAGAFLIAMRLTQQGKFLIWALAALALAGLVIGIEWFWVTDNERIERVVYDLRRAVEASDGPGVLAHLTDDVEFTDRQLKLPGEQTRALVEWRVSNTHFDFLRVTHLKVHAGEQSRRGTAEFDIISAGNSQDARGMAFPASGTTSWSLGFRETRPGIWQVNRITSVRVPKDVDIMPAGTNTSYRGR